MEMTNYSEDTDSNLRNKEDILSSLMTDYAKLRQHMRTQPTNDDITARVYVPEKSPRLYPIGVATCIAVFLASFLTSLLVIQVLSYKFSDIGLISVISGISTGIVTAIIFVVNDNIRTQRLNEKLAAKSHEIKKQRSDILTYLQGTMNK